MARAVPPTQNQLAAHFKYLCNSSQEWIEKFIVFSSLVSPEEDFSHTNRCVTRENNSFSVVIQRLHLYCFPTAFPKAAPFLAACLGPKLEGLWRYLWGGSYTFTQHTIEGQLLQSVTVPLVLAVSLRRHFHQSSTSASIGPNTSPQVPSSAFIEPYSPPASVTICKTCTAKLIQVTQIRLKKGLEFLTVSEQNPNDSCLPDAGDTFILALKCCDQ